MPAITKPNNTSKARKLSRTNIINPKMVRIIKVTTLSNWANIQEE